MPRPCLYSNFLGFPRILFSLYTDSVCATLVPHSTRRRSNANAWRAELAYRETKGPVNYISRVSSDEICFIILDMCLLQALADLLSNALAG